MLDPQIKELPVHSRLDRTETSAGWPERYATRETARGETKVPYGAPSRSNRLEGVLVQGFPLTPS